MKIPGGERAIVDIEKLRDYCLSMLHPEGRHKARVFLSALGMTAADAENLRNLLLSTARQSDTAVISGVDEYGRRYVLDVEVASGSRHALIRSAWIVKSGENFPRLTSCYVLRGAA